MNQLEVSDLLMREIETLRCVAASIDRESSSIELD